MEQNKDVFSDEYVMESGTEIPNEPTEEEIQNQTVSGETGEYDKSKPHRVVIRAREIK